MKRLISAFLLIWGTNSFAEETPNTEENFDRFVPKGYVITDKIYGDLNKDKQDDVVLLIKGTDKSNFVNDEYRGELDRNRRGIVVAFKKHQKYEVVFENNSCFSSENEDGGVYYPPELEVFIEKGNLYFSYSHGRYGYWVYNFRYQGADFDLIGFDSNESRGPITERIVSVNFLTKKMLVKDNINMYSDFDEAVDQEVFKETWTNFELDKRIKLSEINDLDDLYVEGLLKVKE